MAKRPGWRFFPNRFLLWSGDPGIQWGTPVLLGGKDYPMDMKRHYMNGCSYYTNNDNVVNNLLQLSFILDG